jgi:hypothetical protein
MQFHRQFDCAFSGKFPDAYSYAFVVKPGLKNVNVERKFSLMPLPSGYS